MKKLLSICILLALVYLFQASSKVVSFGAPASSTGAPGESSCAKSGCHDTFGENEGTALLTLEVGEGVTSYVPGNTYAVKISIRDDLIVRFGFETVILQDANRSNAGNPVLTDPGRTQIITNSSTLQDRLYVTYTYEGSSAVSSGLGQWEFDWTAPTAGSGSLTIYLGAVSANNDDTDDGDYVYTSMLNLSEDKSTVTGQTERPEFRIFVDVNRSQLVLRHINNIQSLNIYNMAGISVGSFDPMKNYIHLPDLPAGVYLIHAISHERVWVKKFAWHGS